MDWLLLIGLRPLWLVVAVGHIVVIVVGCMRVYWDWALTKDKVFTTPFYLATREDVSFYLLVPTVAQKVAV
jgi:hypothetical protein